MLLRSFSKIIDIDVSLGVALHRDNLEASHGRRGRIGSVRRGRNQANISLSLSALTMIFPNHQQPGVFSLRSGIGLDSHRIEPGNRRQPTLQLKDQLTIPGRLSRGANGWIWPSSGQVTGSISAAAFSFIVQDPSGIIEVVSDKSLDSSLCR